MQENVHTVGAWWCIIKDSSTRRVCCQHPILITSWAQDRRGVLAAAVVQRAIMGISRAEGWQGLARLQPYICAEVRHMLLKVLYACSEGGDLHTQRDNSQQESV